MDAVSLRQNNLCLSDDCYTWPETKWAMFEFYKYALHNLLWLCSTLMAPVVYGFSSWLITSLAKEVMFLVALVSLSVCLFVCGQHYSKSYERIGMTFYGRVLSSTRKNWLNIGGDLVYCKMSKWAKNTVIVVAYPDRGEGILFFYFFWGGWVVFHNQGSTFLQWTIWE